jgi:hypothetical protein
MKIEITMDDMLRHQAMASLFSLVLALANSKEIVDPLNEDIEAVREHLKLARTLINEADGPLDHATAALCIGRAYECLDGDSSLREQAKALTEAILAQGRL